ncbi:MAG: hypothetical protein J6N76_09940 [Lachnospiraceae bacterium]|nr:hypothetical protein [Lachnospiraceae bacterium]
MNEKSTERLNQILNSTHLDEFESYREDNKRDLFEGAEGFCRFIRECILKKDLTQQRVFLNADIPERYGYKLLSGEKRTRQRDVILRICYAAEMSLDETQRALRLYGLPELYAKIPRDAFLMITFNERPGSIIEVNALLKEHDLEPLRTSGVQD